MAQREPRQNMFSEYKSQPTCLLYLQHHLKQRNGKGASVAWKKRGYGYSSSCSARFGGVLRLPLVETLRQRTGRANPFSFFLPTHSLTHSLVSDYSAKSLYVLVDDGSVVLMRLRSRVSSPLICPLTFRWNVDPEPLFATFTSAVTLEANPWNHHDYQ